MRTESVLHITLRTGTYNRKISAAWVAKRSYQPCKMFLFLRQYRANAIGNFVFAQLFTLLDPYMVVPNRCHLIAEIKF